MHKLVGWSVLLTAVGCAGVTPEERNTAIESVKLSKAEAPDACRRLGSAEGKDYSWGVPKYEVALEKLQVEAARQGANYVVIDAVRQPGPNLLLVAGRLYSCPSSSSGLASTPKDDDEAPGQKK